MDIGGKAVFLNVKIIFRHTNAVAQDSVNCDVFGSVHLDEGIGEVYKVNCCVS